MAKNTYGVLWLVTEPFLALLYVLVVLELYTLVFQKYRGIASLGRWAVFAGLVLGIAIAALTLSADLSNPNEKFPLLRYFFVLQRGVTTSLLLFLLFLTVFLVWYPVPLSRNLIAHSVLFAVYFLCVTLAFLMRNLAGSNVAGVLNVGIALTTLACFVSWTAFLTRAGEQRSVSIGQHWNADDQQHVLDQLAAINSALLRTARK